MAFKQVVKPRFWAKVALPDAEGCMLWLAGKSRDGYGAFWFAEGLRTAHRVSLILTEGEPPEPDMEAAHSCRNRDCVAPWHLRWATTVENSADRIADGTLNIGARNALAKLTAEQVLEIRRRHAAGGISQKKLALEYGVSPLTVYAVLHRKTWAWLEDEPA